MSTPQASWSGAAYTDSFTRAAERIPIAQPAISQQIRRLEAELGERLFIRDRHGITLTPTGQALLPIARAALQAAEGGREAVAALSGLLTGRLVLGLVHGSCTSPRCTAYWPRSRRSAWTCSRSESSHRNADHQNQRTAPHLDGR